MVWAVLGHVGHAHQWSPIPERSFSAAKGIRKVMVVPKVAKGGTERVRGWAGEEGRGWMVVLVTDRRESRVQSWATVGVANRQGG